MEDSMMKHRLTSVFIVVMFALTLPLLASGNSPGNYVHHELKIQLEPGKRFIRVEDKITIPRAMLKENIHFLLHGNLVLVSEPDNVRIKTEKAELKSEFFGINTARFEIKKKIPLAHYSMILPGQTPKDAPLTVTLVYEGKIYHEIEKAGAEYARGFSETPGIISEKGAYLAGAAFWVPWFNDELVTFSMKSDVPAGWDVVSQGKRTVHEQKGDRQLTAWDSPEPMDEVYLVAAQFKEYGIQVRKVKVLAFLRKPDETLANKYLETTGQYLEMYENLIGPYPYWKFALIENFWETGYGMPSFTLLGPKVIRFPFILHSSYPHELLHNWWGNSVFVDYESGNWCEGLTVYQADHLIKEQRGQGEAYRRDTLQGYTHYSAGKEKEFPLTEFRARYDALSSSIGYGKSMMLYHMLRQMVGDKSFNKIIQHFNKSNKYKRATFEDIRKSAEAVTGKDLGWFFNQWVTRKGAAELRVNDAEVKKENGKYRLGFALEQVQPGEPYRLFIPAAIYSEGQKDADIRILELNEKSKRFEILLNNKPLGMDVDPQFDVFRVLHANEIPPTLSNAFGADGVLMLLPSKSSPEMLKAYGSLAAAWAKESKGKIEIKTDNDMETLPADRAVWLLGHENIHINVIKEGIAGYRAAMTTDDITINKKKLGFPEKSIIAAVKNKKNLSNVVVLLSSDRPAAVPGLKRKLPHYGKYSFLAFEGDEPANVFKGQWPSVNSPMSVRFDDAGEIDAKLPKRKPLARLAPLFSQKRMMGHIESLASEELEGRGLGSKGLEKAAHYIAMAFKNAGLEPGGDKGSYYQSWEKEVTVGKGKRNATLRNVIGVIPGTNKDYDGQSVVLCAHYDHLGLGWPDVKKGNEGKIHFGADDNASGVAVMLELAQVLSKSLKPERRIVFIAFTGEESGLMGSKYYVENLDKVNNIMGVVNLDTVGRLEEGKKLLVIGGTSAREWRFIFMGIGYTVGIETQLVTQDLDASDQVSFIKKGVPGIQLFSGPHPDYHAPTDTVDKIVAAGLVKVASAAKEAIVYLSGRKDRMTFTGQAAGASKAKPASPTPPKSGRRVRTGVMPDFAFSGKGVKVGFVSPASPAHKAGLKKGDIIIKLAGVPVANLKEYSAKLKTFQPGDSTTLAFLRDGKEQTIKITLTTR